MTYFAKIHMEHQIKEIIRQIAARRNISEVEVRNGIKEAIEISMSSEDQKVKDFWAGIPVKRGTPSLEESLAWIIYKTEAFPEA